MILGIYGPGNARDYACAMRLVREIGKNSFLFFLCGANALLQREPWVRCAAHGAAAAAVMAKDEGVGAIIILDPELLISGASDAFRMAGILVLGPNAASSTIEGSKRVMKGILETAGVATPASVYCATPAETRYFLSREWSHESRYVLKSDVYLADAHLRTIVPSTLEEALDAIDAQALAIDRFAPGSGVLVERQIKGAETSVHILWDGQSYILLPPVKDYKPVADGDCGPNTHGAAAIACGRGFPHALECVLREHVIEPTLAAIRRAGLAYRGFLYFGMMLTDTGPQVLELNVRPGNPEILTLLALLESDFSDLLGYVLRDDLDRAQPRWRENYFAGAVFAMAAGYPMSALPDPVPIEGLDGKSWHGEVIGEGVGRDFTGKLVVMAGRVAAAVAVGPTIESVRCAVYADLANIQFIGKHQRNDLGAGVGSALFAAEPTAMCTEAP